MSNDTAATPKLSILTDAAMRAKAKMTATPTDEEGATTEKKFNPKRVALIGVGATVAAGAAVYAVIKLFTGESIEEETSEEVTETEDN